MLDHEGQVLVEGALVLRSEGPRIWRLLASTTDARPFPGPQRLSWIARTLEEAAELPPDARPKRVNDTLPSGALVEIGQIAAALASLFASSQGEDRRAHERISRVIGDLNILLVRYAAAHDR